jgi:DNA repair exonuclease SbcCD nuclease subunit
MARKQLYSPVHIINRNKEPDESSIGIHCHKRLRIAITLGLLLRKIAERKKVTEAIITFEGAKIQDGKGNKRHSTEAAHNLPRNVLLNGNSIWEFVNDPECNFHERVKKQIYLTAASTVIVKKEINYVDSQWENNGLLDIYHDYLCECIKIKIDSEDEAELLVDTAKKFIGDCKKTLIETKEKIKNRETYKKKKEILDEIIEKYYFTIDNFNYRYRVELLLSIYQIPKYR